MSTAETNRSVGQNQEFDQNAKMNEPFQDF